MKAKEVYTIIYPSLVDWDPLHDYVWLYPKSIFEGVSSEDLIGDMRDGSIMAYGDGRCRKFGYNKFIDQSEYAESN